MSRRTVIVLAVVLLVGAGLWLKFRPTPEKAVRKRFAALAEVVSRGGDEAVTSTGLKMTRLGVLLAPEVTITVSGFPGDTQVSSERLVSEISRGRMLFSRIALRFHDLQIRFPDRQTAEVTCSARLSMTASQGGESVDEFRRLHCRLVRPERAWVFEAFSEEPLLRR